MLKKITVVKVVGYTAITLIAFLAIEIASFAVCKYLAKFGVFFDKSIITQPYSDYLMKRDLILGWLPREIDRYGARRDPSAYADSPPCVDVYGDSFTWGDEVDDHESWPSLLTSNLHCRVRNYGVGGYGTDQAYLRFSMSKMGSSQVVILNHLSENIIRNVNQFRNLIYPGPEFAFKPRFIFQGKNRLELIETPDVPRNEILNFLSNPSVMLESEYFLPNRGSGVQYLKYPYTLSLLQALKHWHIQAKLHGEVRHAKFYEPMHASRGLLVTQSILENFALKGRELGIRPIITILPTCKDFEYYETKNRFPYSILVSNLRKDGIFVIDVGDEMFSKVGAEYRKYYRTCSTHLNPDGNKVVAEIIANRIASY